MHIEWFKGVCGRGVWLQVQGGAGRHLTNGHLNWNEKGHVIMYKRYESLKQNTKLYYYTRLLNIICFYFLTESSIFYIGSWKEDLAYGKIGIYAWCRPFNNHIETRRPQHNDDVTQ